MSDPVRHPTDDRLQEWIDGELPGEAAARVAEHVAACGRCRREAERIRELLGALHDLPREMTAPAGIRTGARGRLSGNGEPATESPPPEAATLLRCVKIKPCTASSVSTRLVTESTFFLASVSTSFSSAAAAAGGGGALDFHERAFVRAMNVGLTTT